MKETPAHTGLTFQVDLHQCELPEAEIDRLRADLDSLERQVEKFPVADLHVLVEYNNRTTDYSVKTSLILPGTSLVASERDLVLHAAYQRCLDVLSDSLRAYKDRLGQVEE